MNFDSFSFDARIMAGIKAAGYATPTPIQQRAMGDVLSGRDVLGLAQTGTGKTAAFALPLLQRLLTDKDARRGKVRVLVLAPTRELALQIHETFIELGRQTGLRSAAVFGGVGQNPQIKALSRASICVACPGRLLDLLNQGRADLSAVSALVLDEADRMFDMGFLPDLRKIMAHLPRERQNLLFSATMPAEIKTLADGLLSDPAVVQVANNAPPKAISHAYYRVPTTRKADFLEALLADTDHESVLVFTRTKHRAKSLAAKLARKGWATTSLQGNLSQNKRQQALSGFRDGKYAIMVATDIAARGIDCERISHVINFDMPDSAETYTHRIGRTGRAERSGQAMTIVSEDDLRQMRAIQRVLGSRIDEKKLDGFDFPAFEPAPAKPAAKNPRSGRPYSSHPRRGAPQRSSRRGRSAAR